MGLLELEKLKKKKRKESFEIGSKERRGKRKKVIDFQPFGGKTFKGGLFE